MRIGSQLAYNWNTPTVYIVKNLIVGLDHIGIAVNKIETALPIYEKFLGLKLKTLKTSKQHGIRVALLAAGDTSIELLEPLNTESPISKFLEKRGQGVHHLAFKVSSLEQMLQQLKNEGLVLIDEKPRRGIEGGMIAFLHPKSTGNVLIELCEH